MGAAQGNLAGTEIVEQSPCSLHMRKVGVVLPYHWVQVATEVSTTYLPEVSCATKAALNFEYARRPPNP
jgi:hypothetical protein